MSRDELRKYLPDSPKELSFIGSSIVRLGSAMSGVLIFSENPHWVLLSGAFTWLGHEMNEYFKLHEPEKKP